MNKLSEQMWSVAKEYARLFGEIISMEPEYWVGDCPDQCCFGDTMFFSLEEMRMVVDDLPKYVKKHGSRGAVGYEIHAWMDWLLDGIPEDGVVQYVTARVTYQLRPNISLQAWLNGHPREGCHPWDGPDADYLRLQEYRETLLRLIDGYGPDRELKIVYADVNEQLRRAAVEKKKRDDDERFRQLFRDAMGL